MLILTSRESLVAAPLRAISGALIDATPAASESTESGALDRVPGDGGN